MADEGDYIIANKSNLIAKSGITTQTGLIWDSYHIAQNFEGVNFWRMKPEDAFRWYRKLANLSRENFLWFKFLLESIFIDGPMWQKLNNGKNCTYRLYFSPSPSLAFFLFKLDFTVLSLTECFMQFPVKVTSGCRSPINICVPSSVPFPISARSFALYL